MSTKCSFLSTPGIRSVLQSKLPTYYFAPYDETYRITKMAVDVLANSFANLRMKREDVPPKAALEIRWINENLESPLPEYLISQYIGIFSEALQKCANDGKRGPVKYDFPDEEGIREHLIQNLPENYFEKSDPHYKITKKAIRALAEIFDAECRHSRGVALTIGIKIREINEDLDPSLLEEYIETLTKTLLACAVHNCEDDNL